MSAAKGKRAQITSGDKLLTESPTNLKEAIDWILRITNQDGLENNSSTTSSSGAGGSGAAASNTDKKVCICQLAEAVRDLFRNVEQQLEPWEKKLVDDIVVQIRDVGGTHHLKELIYRLGYDLGKFVRGTSDGKPNGIINQTGYKSHYKSGSTLKEVSKKADDLMICARILLGAIPMIFAGLSYLYWWSVRGSLSSDTTTGDNFLLCQFMMRMGYNKDQLQGHDGKKLHELIGECNILGNKQGPGQGTTTDDTSGKSFAQYLDNFREISTKEPEKTKEKLNENALIKLNILCAGYFRSLHRPQDLHCRNPRTPRTVREILYWLTNLPYCPVYRVLISKIKELCQRSGDKGEITFYSGNNKSCTITDENCTTFLLAGALAAPLVLLSIQDTIESLVPKVQGGQGNTTRIDIHDMYANYLFKFSYPVTETQSYYVLQDCLVALYFQLYFLRLQCNWSRTDKDGFGWPHCRYGADVNGDQCSSWICPTGYSGNNGKTDYANILKDHSGKCGQNGSGNTGQHPSPLQAFLCDCLPGFSCTRVKAALEGNGNDISTKYSECYPPFLEHSRHTSLVFGQECPIPMGFRYCFKGSTPGQPQQQPPQQQPVGMSGLGIEAVLDAYANDDLTDSCLYQITRCICSLTRRVPRSTGTLYGFFYGLVDVYSGEKDNGKPITNSLLGELRCYPGTCDPTNFINSLYNWRGMTHTKETNGKEKPGYHENGTLDSLNACQTESVTCGFYLKPLTGSLYNSVATQYCDTYVSWILYLSGRLQSGLESLREAFANVDCGRWGCKKPGANGGQGTDLCDCAGSCVHGKHGSDCKCSNVVECVGVLSLFYRFGFCYSGAKYLAGKEKVKVSIDVKRTCSDFYQHLDSVIKGTYYKELQTQLRNFIYSTRALFGVYIGVYWSIVIVYLLWSMTYNLDLIHIRSHWRSPRSYLVPLQRILADGSRNVKRVCTIGYFQEGTEDRLLSEGVSDLYM